MPFIETLGQQMAGQTGGGLLGLALSGINDDRQIAQQQRLNVLNREMMDYQYGKQYDLWKKTGPGGMTEELKKAGLNPALIYGMSGAGGGTTGSGSGGGSQATGHAGEAMALMNNMNAAMTAAQIENIKADTQKKVAETGNVSKTGENIEANTALMKKETELKEIDRLFQENTRGNREDLIAQELNIRKEQLQIIENDATISEETKNDQIKRIKAEAVQAVLEKARIIADTKLKGAQKDAAIKSISLMQAEMENMINLKNIRIDELQERATQRRQELINEGDDNPVNQILGVLLGFIGGTGAKRTVVEGFKQRY